MALPGSSEQDLRYCSALSLSWGARLTADSPSPVGKRQKGRLSLPNGHEAESDCRHPGSRPPQGILREHRARLDLSTFFRKKFLPDFLSPLLVRTPRWRIYRLIAVTTAALRGGDSEVRAPEADPQQHTMSAMTKTQSPQPVNHVLLEERRGSQSQEQGCCSREATVPLSPGHTPFFHSTLYSSHLFSSSVEMVCLQRKKFTMKPQNLASLATEAHSGLLSLQ